MRNIVGRPVRGDDFFDREPDLARLWREARDNHVLLLAPRRVGKTSLLLRLVEHARANGAVAIYISVADVRSEEALVRKLDEEVRRLLPAESATTDVVSDWRARGRQLLATIRRAGGRWCLLIDELPLFVMSLVQRDATIAEAREFLQWFRDLRQGPVDGDDDVRWVLAGSVGLDTVTRRFRLTDTTNDLLIQHLGPFTIEIADRFLMALSEACSISLAPDQRRRICDLAGWLVPFHLQLLFSAVHDRYIDIGASASPSLVDDAFEDLLGPGRRSYFNFWTERLTAELGGPHDGWALDLLRACSLSPDGCRYSQLIHLMSRHISHPATCDSELAWLVDVLQSDGYLVEHEGRLRFRSNLLREFWLRRFA